MQLIKTKSFTLAANVQGDPAAPKLALVLPGRLDTKDYIHMTSLVEYLAAQGYLAISFDPPGTWDSPGGIDIYSTTNYIQAVHELIELYGNRPTVLAGHSRGGTIAIQAGATNPAVTAIIPIMASYGIPTPPSPEEVKAGVHISPRDLPPGTSRTKEQRTFELPIAYFTDGAQYDSAAVLQTCPKPKFLIYADDDEFTAAEEVETLFAKLPEPKRLLKFHCKHDYRLYAELVTEVNQAIGQFLRDQA